jgi:LEA14-like dessication related protein
MPAKRFRLFLFLLALLPGFSGCSSVKAPLYQDTQNFRVHSVSFTQVVFAMDIRYYNPNNFGVDLRSADIDAYLNNKYLGKAIIDENIPMRAKDTFSLPVQFQIGVGDLVSQGISMLNSNNTEVLIRMDGTILAGKAGVFVRVPVHYEGKQAVHY